MQHAHLVSDSETKNFHQMVRIRHALELLALAYLLLSSAFACCKFPLLLQEPRETPRTQKKKHCVAITNAYKSGRCERKLISVMRSYSKQIYVQVVGM